MQINTTTSHGQRTKAGSVDIVRKDPPTGPFTEKKLIYTLTDTVQGHYPFFYLPIAHPEFINKKNELLINYSINGYGTCVEGCINGRFNPEYYQPQAIRLPLTFLDPKW